MKYFTLLELTVTHYSLPNVPNEEQTKNLEVGVEKLLDPLREMWCAPIIVNSAFRSPEVNEAVGGAKNSQHLTGQAFDITSDNNRKLFELIKDNFSFDQLIDERDYAWIHVSYNDPDNNRNQILHL